MTLHLLKTAVGIDHPDQLLKRQKPRHTKFNGTKVAAVYTRYRPKREDDILADEKGSIYWIIKGAIRARQKIHGFETHTDDEGRDYCLMMLDREVITTSPLPHRHIQGWRYLDHDKAPHDIDGSDDVIGFAEMPQDMLKDLQKLGLV